MLRIKAPAITAIGQGASFQGPWEFPWTSSRRRLIQPAYFAVTMTLAPPTKPQPSVVVWLNPNCVPHLDVILETRNDLFRHG